MRMCSDSRRGKETEKDGKFHHRKFARWMFKHSWFKFKFWLSAEHWLIVDSAAMARSTEVVCRSVAEPENRTVCVILWKLKSKHSNNGGIIGESCSCTATRPREPETLLTKLPHQKSDGKSLLLLTRRIFCSHFIQGRAGTKPRRHVKYLCCLSTCVSGIMCMRMSRARQFSTCVHGRRKKISLSHKFHFIRTVLLCETWKFAFLRAFSFARYLQPFNTP